MALERLGVDFEHYRMFEIDDFAVKSYNAVHGTDFPVTDICKVSAKDMGIVDKDKYDYIFTYSFPCTDISVAGQQKGMAKDSGTRSALLWEVQRILDELKETGSLPQVLLMENVAAIVSHINAPHLRKWTDYLQSLGYSSSGQILNASDYGVAQNRERYFLVSILGNYNYNFVNRVFQFHPGPPKDLKPFPTLLSA